MNDLPANDSRCPDGPPAGAEDPVSSARAWAHYRRLCNQPQVLSRWVLERTLAVLGGGPGTRILEDVLAARPLPRPPDHRGPAAADMFLTDLTAAEVDQVLSAVLGAEAAGRLSDVLGRSRNAPFIAVWHEYQRWAAARAEAGTRVPDAEVPPPGNG